LFYFINWVKNSIGARIGVGNFYIIGILSNLGTNRHIEIKASYNNG